MRSIQTQGAKLARRDCKRAIVALALAALILPSACGEQREASPETTHEPKHEPRPKRAARSQEPRQPPNLILVTLDTVRADALGAYGQRLPASPNIDRLASEGVLFERVTTSNPETLPAHATLFTGRHPFHHGVRSNAGYVLADRNVTLAEHLASRGYVTGAEVAARVLSRATRVTQGFQHYRGAESDGVKLKRVPFPDDPSRSFVKPVRTGSDITTRGIQFVRQNRTRKFFLWLHYFDAHKPWAPPSALATRLPTSAYHAEVASVDEQLGRLTRELMRLRLDRRTLVVVTADHGEGLGEHEEDSHAFFVYDTTMRVPLLVWGLEALPAGRRVAAPARTIDVAPTVLALMGLPPLHDADGASLVPLIGGEVSDLSLTGYGEATALTDVFGTSPLRFVEQGRWKYIHKVVPELYDVRADPGETRNLAAREPEVAARLRVRLGELLASAAPADETARRAVDPATAAQLQALGYLAAASEQGIADDAGSLELTGDDPNAKAADVRLLGNAGALLESGRAEPALAMLLELRQRNPESVVILGRLAEAFGSLGREGEAFEVMERIHALGSTNPAYMNNYAWALATSADDALRDGPRAVAIAEAMIAVVQTPDANQLDTLAAALAEAGRFDEAVETARRAVREWEEGGGDRATLVALRAHLATLESGRPIRSASSDGS